MICLPIPVSRVTQHLLEVQRALIELPVGLDAAAKVEVALLRHFQQLDRPLLKFERVS